MGEALPLARQAEVARALREFLPARAVLWEEEDTRPYECDGLTAYRQLPMVVALPETEEQVQRILKTCSAMAVPVVPRGAGTGLSGGALPPGDGVLLSMAKFMRVLRIDPLARVAVVQPGVHNVLGLRGFTVDGEPFELGGAAPDAPGFDLLALVVGSEGMLVVVTEVTLKLLPKPQCARVIMASFDDVEKAGAAVADVIAAGIVPAGVGMMERAA